MSSIYLVWKEWEKNESIRETVRQKRCLLQWEKSGHEKINIKNASANFLVLKPLARRLLVPQTGVVGMHTLPKIMAEPLA